MARYRRKKNHNKNKFWKRIRNKKPVSHIDQIQEQILSGKRYEKLKNEVDLDLPAAGQYECVQCAFNYLLSLILLFKIKILIKFFNLKRRFFSDENSLKSHKRTKLHKKMVKRIGEDIYTQKEADLAGGIGYD
ncbi:hypothetical protein MHBO_002695 [Bonamia ostreae]|uniref:Uncharacterized protein n=1 Tax=Bonamia ostreae TaxID=126728 RepID=A0ABV2AN69_9EUKA